MAKQYVLPSSKGIRNFPVLGALAVMVGLLVGMGVGTFARKTWGRLAKVDSM